MRRTAWVLCSRSNRPSRLSALVISVSGQISVEDKNGRLARLNATQPAKKA
ncbi:hypothetical protein D3C86_2164200 [compost metagenome]